MVPYMYVSYSFVSYDEYDYNRCGGNLFTINKALIEIPVSLHTQAQHIPKPN